MSKDTQILLTGATGFVGKALMKSLENNPQYNVTGLCRVLPKKVEVTNLVALGNLATVDFAQVLQDKSVVIHAAARAHIMRDEVADPLAEYRKVNVEGTVRLAKQAIDAGVRRFIYISSIKVNGESTTHRMPFSAVDKSMPEDAYGISKDEAEQALKKITEGSSMELVIIRPPLVYGAGVKANFLSLIKLSAKPIPLPFGLVQNKRSMVYVGNLVDFILRCIEHPAAANQTFLVSDGKDLSLKKLIAYIRQALGRPAWLAPVPLTLFKIAGKLTGKSGVVDRLIGDLQVDSSKAQSLLGWKPPFTVQQGIEQTVLDFKNKEN